MIYPQFVLVQLLGFPIDFGKQLHPIPRRGSLLVRTGATRHKRALLFISPVTHSILSSFPIPLQNGTSSPSVFVRDMPGETASRRAKLRLSSTRARRRWLDGAALAMAWIVGPPLACAHLLAGGKQAW